MHVIATAGHVDHGKSTLVKALTGSDPDRLAAEKKRGLSIELGYAWTSLPGAGDVAFVDVPGHERFVTTMLAGVGPVPAVLLVVAADDPWMPQAAEHLAALDALGVAHGVVAVTRSDLADPAPMLARAREEVDRTSLSGATCLAVSAATGAGLAELRSALDSLVARLDPPDPEADVRVWVDRSFTVRGAGTVVTGTLRAGRVAVGDVLAVVAEEDIPVRVRGVQALGHPVDSVSAVARVALNVTGADRAVVDRHSVLVTPDAWHGTRTADVRLTTRGQPGRPPSRPILHVGAAAVPAYLRPLGPDVVRLTWERRLPLRVGDRALLRDPGSRRVWGVRLLDPMPPALRRRGAAAARAAELAAEDGRPDLAQEVRRRRLVDRRVLRQLGVLGDGSVPPGCLATADGWLISEDHATGLRDRLRREVEDAGSPVPIASLTHRLGLPSAQVTAALVEPPLTVTHGRVTQGVDLAGGRQAALPEELATAVTRIEADLRQAPFAAPTAERLAEVGLPPSAVTAAARAGRLLHLGQGVVLLPGADEEALRLLRGLPQPFTTSEARRQLGTSRRVVLPLLQALDRQGRTRRLSDDRREVVNR